MTKLRVPATYEETVVQVAEALTWAACATICGVTQRSVRNWSDPDCGQRLRIEDAERLDRAFIAAGGGYAPFHRLMARRLEITARPAGGASLTLAMGAFASTAGRAIETIIIANDRPESSNARRDALRAVHDAIDKLTDIAAILGGGTDR
ncbi:hypothetical protein [Sphingomonas sp.]|uniref:hypothetical protein n=1 Tax=Sphingomonas sp. TaxID=28214 RepID=UPI00307D55D7